MTWTTPAAAPAGAALTSTFWDAQVKGNLDVIGGPRTAWTPTWTASGSNPSIGNGTITGGVALAGKLSLFWAEIVMGTTTTYGTGTWQITLPAAETTHRWAFQAIARDASVPSSFPLWAERSASGLLTLGALPTTAGNALAGVSSTVPFTWAQNDVLFVHGTYEAQ